MLSSVQNLGSRVFNNPTVAATINFVANNPVAKTIGSAGKSFANLLVAPFQAAASLSGRVSAPNAKVAVAMTVVYALAAACIYKRAAVQEFVAANTPAFVTANCKKVADMFKAAPKKAEDKKAEDKKAEDKKAEEKPVVDPADPEGSKSAAGKESTGE